MSIRYSSSPTLLLRIGSSRRRTILYVALCLLTAYVLWSMYARGHAVLAASLAPVAMVLLWRLRLDVMRGAQLRWCRGHWTLQQGATQRAIALTRRSTATPWVIYLAFSELRTGAVGQIWLYTDSAPAEQLRRLRVRLTLLQ